MTRRPRQEGTSLIPSNLHVPEDCRAVSEVLARSRDPATVRAPHPGVLYGTTVIGGASNLGTVFKLSPGGTETVLHSFGHRRDGARPLAGLIADPTGNLYGTTQLGGATGSGVELKLSGTWFVPYPA